MSEIKKIQHDYVTIKGELGVINEGTGYSIVHIYTGNVIARNITSFLDAVKTVDYLLEGQVASPPSSQTPIAQNPERNTPRFDVPDDVQRLIEKYAPETTKVDKAVKENWYYQQTTREKIRGPWPPIYFKGEIN